MFVCFSCFFSPVKIDGKKVSSIKDLIQEAQPDEQELNKTQDVAEKLKAFLKVNVFNVVFVFYYVLVLHIVACYTTGQPSI